MVGRSRPSRCRLSPTSDDGWCLELTPRISAKSRMPMGSTSTNEGVGLTVGLCVKQTPKSPFLRFRRKAIESFSCYRWVFQVCRLERGGGNGQVPRPSANFGVVRSTVRYLRFKRRGSSSDFPLLRIEFFYHDSDFEYCALKGCPRGKVAVRNSMALSVLRSVNALVLGRSLRSLRTPKTPSARASL